MSFQHSLICHRSVCQSFSFPINVSISTLLHIQSSCIQIETTSHLDSQFTLCCCTRSLPVPSPAQIRATSSPTLHQPNISLFPASPSAYFLIAHNHFIGDLICSSYLRAVDVLFYSSGQLS